MRRPIIGGFTLLEVMVAVAILGLSLVAIFSSEGGAIRAGARARQISVATLLARCKMGEIEEQMLREGFPAISSDGEDECCEGAEHDGFRCEWSVERVELPDTVDTGDDPLAAAGLGGDHEGDSATGMDIENALGGAAGGDAIGELAIQYAFPVLRPAIEEQVRRATVTVYWAEGQGERHFDVVQYLVSGPAVSQGIAPP
ncbi:MAG: prepilin-type N-terminal cleavage/methylation domain-containing protein [Sandaracinaceae bacterium]